MGGVVSYSHALLPPWSTAALNNEEVKTGVEEFEANMRKLKEGGWKGV